MSRHIGILVTNTDHSDFAKRHPWDGEKFETLMKAARPEWTFRAYDCTAGVFPKEISECDGYIISGSPASVNDKHRWIADLISLIQKLDEARTPTIGCCFGHQAIAAALGGAVSRNPGGWGFGVSPTRFGQHEPWMIPQAKTINLYAAHSEQVTTLPARAEILGGDDFCPIGSFKVGQHFFTTEYHPEMTASFFNELTSAFESYVGTPVAEKARKQAEQPTQNVLFAEWMAKFFELDR